VIWRAVIDNADCGHKLGQMFVVRFCDATYNIVCDSWGQNIPFQNNGNVIYLRCLHLLVLRHGSSVCLPRGCHCSCPVGIHIGAEFDRVQVLNMSFKSEFK
jgi:hypothetical protein